MTLHKYIQERFTAVTGWCGTKDMVESIESMISQCDNLCDEIIDEQILNIF